MIFTKPSKAELRDVAGTLNIDLTDEEAEAFQELVALTLADLESIHSLPEPSVAPEDVTYGDRSPTHRPTGDDNPHNVWITKCRVDGAASGPLDGTTVGLKDNISLAGVEMTCGSRLLEGYVPDVDATVVRRLLDAGATIAGKTNMESFSFSSSSDTSDFGAVTNPRDESRTVGGSSSGSAAAVALGEVDVALGCDQGASVRVPASCCGIVGLDPTAGLVPYTGIFPLDPTIDKVGPMARTVADAARTLEAVAGTDGLDPRQPPTVPVDDYTNALVDDVSDLTVGVLAEGFEVEDSDPDVNETVRSALDRLESLGAATESVSVPLHHDAITVGYMIWGFGGLQTFTQGGQGSLLDGWYDTGLMETFGKFRRARADDLPDEGKTTLLTMEYIDEKYGTATYGRAQNVRRELRRQFDDVFEDVDLVAIPTMPIPPFVMDDDADRVERTFRTLTMCRNTVTSSLTDHPSISVPCGTVEGVPVGLLLVGDHFAESTLLRAAHAFERNVDWQAH
ncbi:MAG: amidase [Haloarculaceae archaeon]